MMDAIENDKPKSSLTNHFKTCKQFDEGTDEDSTGEAEPITAERAGCIYKRNTKGIQNIFEKINQQALECNDNETCSPSSIERICEKIISYLSYKKENR